MTGPNLADLRARLAAAQALAAESVPPEVWPLLTRLDGAPVPDGFTAWRVGPEGGPVVAVPAFAPDAPHEFRRRWLARALATALGRCPLCGEVASLDREPPGPGEQGRAAFHALPLYVRVRHATGCPADDFTDAERRWLLPPVGTGHREPDERPTP
ncbi:hypothetical protein [Intrasporangium sp. DVR]|uniref:hypothetical protein n=1 Tax=Intrasporangium sp. DVR TaxID=3127867 RepID=UPI00313A5BE4